MTPFLSGLQMRFGVCKRERSAGVRCNYHLAPSNRAHEQVPVHCTHLKMVWCIRS